VYILTEYLQHPSPLFVDGVGRTGGEASSGAFSMNRLSGKKDSDRNPCLAGRVVHCGHRFAKCRSVPVPVRTSLRLLAGFLTGSTTGQDPLENCAFFGQAAPRPSWFPGRPPAWRSPAQPFNRCCEIL